MIPIEALKALYGQLSGNIQTIWFTEPKPDVGRQTDGARAYIELSLGAYIPKGQDDYRQTYDPVNDKLAANVASYRLVTISMRANSLDPCHQAHDICERVRRGLQSFTARTAYAAENMAYVRVAGVATFKGKLDGVTALISTLDVTFAIAFNTDPGDDPGDYIEQVNGGGIVPFTPQS